MLLCCVLLLLLVDFGRLYLFVLCFVVWCLMCGVFGVLLDCVSCWVSIALCSLVCVCCLLFCFVYVVCDCSSRVVVASGLLLMFVC